MPPPPRQLTQSGEPAVTQHWRPTLVTPACQEINIINRIKCAVCRALTAVFMMGGGALWSLLPGPIATGNIINRTLAEDVSAHPSISHTLLIRFYYVR